MPMNIITNGCVLQVTIKAVSSVVVITTSTEKLSVFTGATIMAPKIQVFLQVALLCYVVTNSIAGVIDFEKAFARLEKEMKDLKEHSDQEINLLHKKNEASDEEINSLHKKNEELEKRLERLEAKG